MKIIRFTNYRNHNYLSHPINGKFAVSHLRLKFKEPTKIHLKDDAMILLSRDKKLSEKHIIKTGVYTLDELNKTVHNRFKEVSFKIDRKYNTIVFSIDTGWTATVSDNLLKAVGSDDFVGGKTLEGTYVNNNSKFSLPIPTTIIFSCLQLDGVEVDGKPSQHLLSFDVTNETVNYNPLNPIFVSLKEGIHYRLDFELIDENYNTLIPETFSISLYNKE